MEAKKTITTIFIVPSLKIGREKLKANGFVNGYEKDVTQDSPQYEDSVYLLFKPEDLQKFRIFMEDEVDDTPQIVDDYDYEGGYVVVVYKLESKFKKDYKLIKEGKYSKTSPEFQALFPKKVNVLRNRIPKEEISLQYRAFTKAEDLRKFWEDKLGVKFDDDMEVWEGYFQENEVLDISKFKKHV
jgi:hypothetical protein